MTDSEKRKRKRFETVAARRVQNTIDSMHSLSKCANRHNYEYSQQDADKMIRVIKTKMRSLELSFKEGLSKERTQFKF
jgi:hypothetical protein